MNTGVMNDLRGHHRAIGEELQVAMGRVLSRGWFSMGPEVEAFEDEFAAFCGVTHCVAVANGTDALELSLRGLGIGAGDEVITVPNAGMYSTAAILATGATPVFADVDPRTLTITAALARAQVSARTRAVIVTHLFGRMAPMKELCALARLEGFVIIEDCAQAHGALQGGVRAGAWGTAAAFSFYPTKNLGAVGDAGAVATRDSDLAAQIRRLRQYGWEQKYHSMVPGGRNSRLDELQAAVLRVKLAYLDQWNQRRRRVAACYAEHLSHADVATPTVEGDDYVAHLFVVRTARRAALRKLLSDNGVATDVHYPRLDYEQSSLKSAFPAVHRANSELAAREVLSLPCYPEISLSSVRACCAVINRWGG